MFRLTSTRPCEIQGTIRVNRPISGLGQITDADGNRWDVNAIYGSVVCAVPLDQLHPYYADTSGASHGLVTQTWKPYQVEVVG